MIPKQCNSCERRIYVKELKEQCFLICTEFNGYDLTLAFIKNKGYSLEDMLEYEKEL